MRTLCNAIIVVLLVAVSAPAAQRANDVLSRRGFFGVALGANESGAIAVTSVIPNSTAAAIGIASGDVIETVDGVAVRTPGQVVETVGAHRPRDIIRIGLIRAEERLRLEAILQQLPYERMPGATVEYGQVQTYDGNYLRTVVSAPDGADGPFPAVMLIQGGGCGSVDTPIGEPVAQPGLMHAIGTQGFVTMRIDKSGVGDSQGPPCATIGYHEELEGYRAGLRALKRQAFVDPDRVFIVGISLGGVFAPVVVNENPVAGVAVYGTLAGPPDPYPGRSDRFFEEFAEVDVLGAWAKVDAPILALHGEYDSNTPAAASALIASTVNEVRTGSAVSMELEKLDHCWTRHESLEASLNNCGGGEMTTELSDTILEFLQAHS